MNIILDIVHEEGIINIIEDYKNDLILSDYIEEYKKKIWYYNETDEEILQLESFWMGVFPDDYLGEEFIIKNKDKYNFHWETLTNISKRYSMNFFEKCKDKLYWWRISSYSKTLSEEFIHKFHKELDFCDLLNNRNIYLNITDDMLCKYKDYIDTKSFLKRYNYHCECNNTDKYERYCYKKLKSLKIIT